MRSPSSGVLERRIHVFGSDLLYLVQCLIDIFIFTSNASYFAMLFAAGIGIGMFYYGVAEPILHYAPGPWGNRFWDRLVP